MGMIMIVGAVIVSFAKNSIRRLHRHVKPLLRLPQVCARSCVRAAAVPIFGLLGLHSLGHVA